MTEREYLKIINELMHVAAYAVGYLQGVEHTDNLYEFKLNAKELASQLNVRLSQVMCLIDED